MSRKPKHTPGPWTIETPMGDENPWIVEAGKQAYEFRCIAIIPCERDGDEIPIPEARANAALMVAAPDLLAAAMKLEAAETFHANCKECEGEEIPELCPKCFPHFDDARVMRRIAIAKATGRKVTEQPTATPAAAT